MELEKRSRLLQSAEAICDLKMSSHETATAAFLNSSLGQGLGPGKLDLSNGSVHSAGMHFLASHRSVDETQTTAEVGSVASCSTQGYAANCNVFDTIQDLSVQGQLLASKTVEALTVSVQISHSLGIKF